MSVYKANDQNLQMVIDRQGLVLVSFWAPWCSSCRNLGPVLEEVSNELADTVMVAKVHIEDNPVSRGYFAIKNVPTMLLFRDGYLINTFRGYKPKASLIQLIHGVL
ncbi:thioredoxin family protein [Brevibacillus ginsengisoli]|uniref:thioredoxin family protein n=1 Tax=Brevibacillus ginsengisoli TaxID=363854 RepID=UPI003CE96DBA